MFASPRSARRPKTKSTRSRAPASRSIAAAWFPKPSPAAQPSRSRPDFQQLLNRLEQDDILIVTKLDRLGRDAIDVSSTVAKLAELGVRVHCLALGGVDLTSAAGRMTMGVINHVAQFERDLLIERTHAGLARAKADGSVLGRPAALGNEDNRPCWLP